MSPDRETFTRVVTVDCSGLQPPEPLVKVLEAVEKMEVNEAVRMLHRQMPRLLFAELEKRGLQYEIYEDESGGVEVLIWRQ